MRKENNGRRSSHRMGVGSVLMRVALVSFCLVLLSAHLISGLFARYSVTGSSSDAARVAKFDVNVSGVPSDAIVVKCTNYNSNTGECTITVTNRSEVAVRYEISVVMDAAGVTPSVSHNGMGELAANSTGSETLTFTIDWAQFTADKTGNSVDVDLAFTVTVNIVQVD